MCRTSLYDAGEPLLKRAQEAGVVRPDVEFPEVMQMVMGIAKIPVSDPSQIEHILRIALDGLRYHPTFSFGRGQLKRPPGVGRSSGYPGAIPVMPRCPGRPGAITRLSCMWPPRCTPSKW